MFRALFTVMTCVIPLVVAQTSIVSVTSPLQGATYFVGQPLVISWINPRVDTISKIQISHGDPAALQPGDVIATDVDAGKGSFEWDIPSDYPTGNDCK
ncbi:uncharacterized protein BX664DRAFT_369917 [Halteromyces radiatus]|uniref:uncharacterized protein n=1 Tax=Halteromyces radiatus TaxID=101107 RepID=UPI00221E6917|nr:uncharacterized protein BX664DRAFT_369917 [Halteromyces radiatus]KAI8096196.1 hypothetical protein BX664DRAFT_369917 [Halteromyces radiatus]